MKLKTRVLSLVLAGSMMLSVVPVSAFAETGTANAASAAVQSDVPANGVYDTEQPGSILISARGCSIKSQDDVIYRSNSCYVVNSHDDQAIPRLTILYGVITDDMPKGHKVIAWRVSMPGKSTPSYGYTDQGQISQLKQLAEVGYEESDNHKTVSFNCVRSVTYNGMALAAIDTPVYFNPVLNVTADDLTFDHALLSLGRSFSSEAVTLHQKFIKVQPDGNVDFNDSSSILTEFPKEAGTYQAFATLSSNFTDPRVPSWNGERYYEIDAKQILTSNDWRFTVNSDISLSVNENGQPVIPDGTTGVHYSGSTLTIDDGNTVHFGYGTPVKCNIENNGVLDGGLFTGTVTGSGSILSGLFVNKPEGADSMLYSFTSGTTFAGMKDTSGTTTLYLVRADGGQDVPLSVSYENSSRQAHGWLLFLNIGLDSNYVLVQNPWTFSNNINVAIPSALANASAVYTPVACMNASDLSIDSTGNVRVSLPDVEVSGVKYTSTDGKTYENYPSDPGTYTATVSLESTRNWQVLVSSSSSLALTGEDAIAVQAENEKWTNRVVGSQDGLYYYVPETLDVKVTVEQSAPASSVVTLTVDENGAPVIPENAKGVRYENNTLTIDANTTARFAPDSTVKCDIVNNGTLDGGLFTGTVTNHGVIESGLFVNKPENADSAKFSFTSGATFCGLKDSSGITSLYVVRTENGQNLHLTASYSNPNRDPFGWVQAIDIPNTTESAYLLYKNPNLNPWTVDVWADSALSKEQTDVATTFTPVACMKSSDLSIDSTGTVNISIPEVEATGVTYTNKATNETFTSYPTVAGDYVAKVSLKCKRNWDSLTSQSPVIPASALLADDGVAALSEEQENPLRRIALKGDLYYYVPETLDVDVTVKQSAPASSVVTLIVDENGAPVIPEGAKGVRYENNTLTIDEHTTAQFAQGSTVKCDIVNNGTLDGGLFTGTVTGSGSIARGLFLHDPKTSLPTMMLSVPENASLNGITAPDATGLTTLYAINTLDGEDNMLLFIGDYIGTDPHTFYGWDLVYSLGDEENSDVEKNYIGHTHFEQPMYGPIPDGMNGVRCIFLPVLEMDASDLTITADKTESKITGAVIESVQYVDESDPNAAPSTVYPTKAGKYKAIVTLTCPGDSTYSKARVARIGNLCYHVPETLEVEVTVELPTVPPTDGDGNVTFEGTDEVKGDGWTAKKDDEGKTTVEITDGKNLNNTTLNCDQITIGSEGTSTTVSNITTNADVTVASGSTIEGGTFSGDVSGTGTIEGGTFSGNVGSEVKINGGVFANEPTNTTAPKAKVTVTGGATVNNLTNDSTNESRSSTVTVVTGKEQTIQLSAEIEGRDLIGWKETAGDNDPTLNTDSSITINQNDETERTFTPVVVMNEKDLTAAGESKITGVTVTSLLYYPVNDAGEITGEGSAERPTEDGSYILVAMLELSSQEPSENGIALFAAENTDLSRVVEQDGIGYYVPESLTVERITNGEDVPSDTGSGDSGAGGAAVAVIGGAAIGGAAYLIGTQVYLTSVLPEGASIPTNRQQLADLLWTAAGKPQPASTALFTDISAEAADSQKAARWCVEQGLLKDTGSTFKPDKHTFRPQVIKAWNDLQAKLNPQK